ncbi:UNVERIFIED_ORG: hypothetical protein M2187_002781 [Bradyrhizobium japonicum]|jgi:hypothetical protein
MPGLVPGINVLVLRSNKEKPPGSSPRRPQKSLAVDRLRSLTRTAVTLFAAMLGHCRGGPLILL